MNERTIISVAIYSISAIVLFFNLPILINNLPALPEKQPVVYESYVQNQLARKMEYIRDTTTGICFAYTGHGLTTVDCEALSDVAVLGFASNAQ